jgi:anti-sigma factor RsiW
MKCTEAISFFSLYLDGALNGSQMRMVSEHMKSCAECSGNYKSLIRTQSLVSGLGRRPAPPDLALRLKVAISQERSVSFERRVQGFLVRLENSLNELMLPASAGLVTAVVMFGVLIGFFALPARLPANRDVPTSLYMPPRLAAAPFSAGMGEINSSSPLVIEAYVDASGRLEDYRIISGEDTEETRKQLDRSLIFTVFAPAMSFGRPASGKVVISFANVNVKG